MSEIKGIGGFKPINPNHSLKKFKPKILGDKSDLTSHLNLSDKVNLKEIPTPKEEAPVKGNKEEAKPTIKEPRKEELKDSNVPKYLTMEEDMPFLGGTKDLPKTLRGVIPAGPSAIPSKLEDISLTPQRGNINGFWATFKAS